MRPSRKLAKPRRQLRPQRRPDTGALGVSPKLETGLVALWTMACVAIWQAVLVSEPERTLLAIAFAAINTAAFGLYGWDKLRAGAGTGRRVPERWLHLMQLPGGSLGAYLGQRLWRHKTQKAAFRRVYLLILLVQTLPLGWVVWQWL